MRNTWKRVRPDERALRVSPFECGPMGRVDDPGPSGWSECLQSADDSGLHGGRCEPVSVGGGTARFGPSGVLYRNLEQYGLPAPDDGAAVGGAAQCICRGQAQEGAARTQPGRDLRTGTGEADAG